jgi:uncharacterized protein
MKEFSRSLDDSHPISCQIKAALDQNECISAVYILGSALTGQLREDSDIDIAILPAEDCSISALDRLRIGACLEQKMGRRIDIGILNNDNLVYASEAILNGRRIITRDKTYAEAHETRLLGCYVQFRQDRHEVEEAYYAN